MAATVIAGATVVTGDAGRAVLYDGAVAVEGDRIAAVGPSDEVLAGWPGAEVVDGRGKAVFPGLVNCHAHLTAVLRRGITEDFGFPPRLEFPVGVDSYLSDEERTVMATLGAIEAIRTGSTTVLEVGRGLDVYAGAIAATGLRLVLAECADDGVTGPEYQPGEPVAEFSDRLRAERVERAGRLFERWHGAEGGRVTCFAATQLVESSSPELLAEVRGLAERFDTGYTIHLDQSRLEVDSALAMHGVRPAEYLYESGFLGPRLVAAHCRYPDAAEIGLLGSTRTAVTHQPAMAARRAVNPPIPALRAAGCPVGLGTDNNTQDMVEPMRAGLFMERILTGDAMSPRPEDGLEWATRDGAGILGMAGEAGSLEAGKKADLFVVDMRKAHLAPSIRIVSAFVHNGQPSDIEGVMADGRWLMRNGRVLTADEPAIIEEADRIGRRAWNRLLSEYPDVSLGVEIAPGS